MVGTSNRVPAGHWPEQEAAGDVAGGCMVDSACHDGVRLAILATRGHIADALSGGASLATMFEIEERTLPSGRIGIRLKRDQARAVIQDVLEGRFKRVLVALSNAACNPEHELVIEQLLNEISPDLPYSLSSRLRVAAGRQTHEKSSVFETYLLPLVQERSHSMGIR